MPQKRPILEGTLGIMFHSRKQEEPQEETMDTRQFQADNEAWTVTRDTGLRTSASSEGYHPKTGLRGLRFTSSKGAQRFLAMGLDDLPSRKELQALSEER